MTTGRMYGTLATPGWLRRNDAAIGGLGTNRLYVPATKDWKRFSGAPLSGFSAPMLQQPKSLVPFFYWGYGGLYKLAGDTKDGTNAPFQSFVLVTTTVGPTLIIRGGYTDASGNFLFDYLAPGTYDVIAYDMTNVYNEAGYTKVTADPR